MILREPRLSATAAGYSRILGANDRVRMGYIGLGNRGDQVHDAFLEHGDQVTAAVCDLRDDYMEFAIKKSRATPKKYKEYKQLLADKDIDAVVIATPDHWHAPMFINACNAGKDVYVEKPLSLTVAEGRHMVETADRTKRVVQVGTNRRSWKTYHEMIEFVHAGGIGKISAAKAFSIRNEWPNGLGSSDRRRAARRMAVGPLARARRPKFRTTRTACSITSAGSTITPAGS